MLRLAAALALAPLAGTPVIASPAPRVVPSQADQDQERSAPIGEPRWIREWVASGPELVAAPGDFRSPIVIRVDSASPHGSDLRYDLVWYGLEPGSYDLLDFLRRVDGSSLDDLTPLVVEVTSVLPPGLVEPNELEVTDVSLFGGYELLLWIGGIVWAGVLLVVVVRRRNAALADAPAKAPTTVADKLRPLIEEALDGSLSQRRRAELELTLISYWRRKLGWEAEGTAAALARLRTHAEAGTLLRALEEWIHSPTPPADVDLDSLLGPYRTATVPEELGLPGGA